MDIKPLMTVFEKPGSEYRGAPFWAWNGRLEPEELRRQIRAMHQMGLGGFFMHSRVGLATAYLSEEWFECVAACVDEAEKLGMHAWLYDEDRWPSGAAGGIVTRNPAFRARSLVMHELNELPRDENADQVLAAFAAEVSGACATKLRRIDVDAAELAPGESLLLFKAEPAPCSSWYNGQTALDSLSHEAVSAFINVTHEAYRERFGSEFGTRIPGIFTDEPNFWHHMSDTSIPSLPWTDRLPAVFAERYGYDLISHLPELFLDIDGQTMFPARLNFHDCVTFLFTDAFARQIGEWCAANNLALTGHVLHEETLSSQTLAVGDSMRFYEHMQAPGIDILTEYNREYDTAKRLSSAARQFDRKWRLTETYGCTGWDFPFSAHKAIDDWQMALGINLRCPHLAWYTMEGEAKRDYPASISYQSPWWESYGKMENYFARLHCVLTRGREVRDLLVINPIESMWALAKRGWNGSPEVKRYDAMIVMLRDSLLAANIDFDYGDEEILARHGRIATTDKESRLIVGAAEYKAVVVPPLLTVRNSTLRLLQQFKAVGGTVLFAGEIAAFVDGRADETVAEFAASCDRAPACGEELAEAVAETCRRVSIADEAACEIRPALHLLREDDEACYLFVCNTGHDAPGSLEDRPVRERTLAFPSVTIRGFEGCEGPPFELDPDTGEAYLADASAMGDGWTVHTNLPALGSRLFVVPKKQTELPFPTRPALRDLRAEALPAWTVEQTEPNVLLLDRPSYSIDAGEWREPEDVLRVDREVRAALGLAPRGGVMVQPWAREHVDDPKHVTVSLNYVFSVDAMPQDDVFLALERPQACRVKLNGVGLDTVADDGWWVDRSLRKFQIAANGLRIGENVLEVEVHYDELYPGLEALYLLGAFGVRVDDTRLALTAPAELGLGDCTAQGLPFYSGSLVYRTTVQSVPVSRERLFVSVPEWDGVGVRVLVNGRSAGIIAWEPHELDITEQVGDAGAELSLELLGHRRNSHGPLHLKGVPRWVGPAGFVATGDDWYEGYHLVPFGLRTAPELVVRSQD